MASFMAQACLPKDILPTCQETHFFFLSVHQELTLPILSYFSQGRMSAFKLRMKEADVVVTAYCMYLFFVRLQYKCDFQVLHVCMMCVHMY